MAHEVFHTIDQLAALCGVPARTIRYYTTEGLLPRPLKRGRRALYTEEHRDRLRLIRKLQDEAYLPLEEIRMQLSQLSHQQVEEALRHSEPPSEARPPTSPISRPAQLLPPWPSSPATSREPAPPSRPSAVVAELRDEMAPRRVPWELPRAADAVYGYAEVLSHRSSSEERWQRLELAPGLELHVSDALPDEIRRQVGRLIEAAERILAGKPSGSR